MVRELNLKFKLAIQQKGGVGVRSLKRIFNQMDFNGNKRLDSSEFEQALAAFGIFPKKVELQALMKYYDVDGDGSISYDEFLSGLKDELSERRVNMVKKAFQILDKDGSGQITVSDIQNIYDVSMNPEFLEGQIGRAAGRGRVVWGGGSAGVWGAQGEKDIVRRRGGEED